MDDIVFSDEWTRIQAVEFRLVGMGPFSWDDAVQFQDEMYHLYEARVDWDLFVVLVPEHSFSRFIRELSVRDLRYQGRVVDLNVHFLEFGFDIRDVPYFCPYGHLERVNEEENYLHIA